MPLFKISKKYNWFLRIIFYLYNLINFFLLKYRISIAYHYYSSDRLLKLINKERFRGELLLTVNESFQLYECVKSIAKKDGDLAEVGVYKGGSSLIIAKIKGKKKLHLFDTFEGLPQTESIDKYVESKFMVGSLEEVKDKLKNFPKIYFYKGMFQQKSKMIKKNKFSFVHLDVDLFSSTKACLEFFYPRMVKGGIILTHDYPFMPGVKKAFDDFFKDKETCVIKMVGNQGLVIKL